MNADPVLASLEQLAERRGDVSQEIFHGFARRCPDWAGLMKHMDEGMVGRMMQDVLVLMMTPPHEIDRGYLSFEVRSHQAYGVTPEMFTPLLESVRDTVREHLPGEWPPALERAWEARIEELTAELTAFGAGAAATAEG